MEEVTTAVSRALQHVKSYSLPIRHGSLELACELAKEGEVEKLISHIVSDIGLLTSLLSEVCKNQHSKKARTLHEILLSNKELILSELGKIKSSPNYHSLDDASESQLARLREALIAIGSSRALAPFCLVDEEIAFSAALVRQLGFLLVAWNYPTVYQEAVEKSLDGDSIDSLVAERLGFHPHTLALAILGDWGLTEALSPVVAPEESHTVTQSLVLSLRYLCQIGEALARANEPTLYPSAIDDWDASKEEILQIAGENGLSAVRDEVHRYVEAYAKEYPISFDSLRSYDPEEIPKSIDRCRESLRKKLENVIRNRDLSPRERLRKITKEIPIEEGFSDGGIYTLEPLNDSLVKRLSIGGHNLLNSYDLDSSSPIPRSYKERKTIQRGETDGYTIFAAPLQGLENMGVLFLRTQGIGTSADFDSINRVISLCLRNTK